MITRRIVCFGDSITGPHPDQKRTYQSGYLKFADILECLLNATNPEVPWQVINRGWAGCRASGGGDQPDAVTRSQTEILPLQPEIVTVLMGANDMAVGSPTTPAACEFALMSLGESLLTVKKVVVMLYAPPLPAPENEARAWHQGSLANPILKKMADHFGFLILDLGPLLVQAAERYGRDQIADPVDGVHLRPMGEIVVATALFRLFGSDPRSGF